MITIDKINSLLREGYDKDEVKNLIIEISEIKEDEYDSVVKDFTFDSEVGEYVIDPIKDIFSEFLSDEEEVDAVKYVIDNIKSLKLLLEEYISNPKKFTPNIKIDLDTTENITKTLRINKKALETFEKFCEENPQHKKMDLISMALIEYVNNHTEI